VAETNVMHGPTLGHRHPAEVRKASPMTAVC
jgi:hypothetical protein